MGVPMRPEEIAELMSNMNQPKIAVTLPENGDRDDPWKKLLEQKNRQCP